MSENAIEFGVHSPNLVSWVVHPIPLSPSFPRVPCSFPRPGNSFLTAFLCCLTSAIKTGFNRWSYIGNYISKQCRISMWYSIFQAFSGRIYATGNPQACFELGNGASEMTLRIPIGTQCGTVQSGRGRYVNHVVIQANPVIMQVEIGIDCCKETVQSSQYHNMVKPH